MPSRWDSNLEVPFNHGLKPGNLVDRQFTALKHRANDKLQEFMQNALQGSSTL